MSEPTVASDIFKLPESVPVDCEISVRFGRHLDTFYYKDGKMHTCTGQCQEEYIAPTVQEIDSKVFTNEG
jgi:hypothetical protein